MNARLFGLRACGLILMLLLAACGAESEPPVKVGVLLPLGGSMDANWRETLDWAALNINDAGGIYGRRLELVYADIANGDLDSQADLLLEDASVRAVIGPATSGDLFAIAPRFIRAEKPLVSPSATSADIFRAFAGKDYIWRTLESDVAQVESLLALAGQEGAESISLLTAANSYGATFFDWFGFMATELGMRIGAVVRYDEEEGGSACASAVAEAMQAAPDTLLIVPGTPEDVPCIIEEARKANPDIRLIGSDAARFPYVVKTLGKKADGLQGLALSSDPTGGFDIAYEVIFGERPSAYAATTYDALLLIAYGLVLSEGEGGARLADAMKQVVDGRGEKVGWDAQGVRDALAALQAGEAPDVSGAASPLDFDRDYYTELTDSYYAHWRVEYGEFVDVDYFSTAGSSRAQSRQSAFRSLASDAHMQNLDGGEDLEPLPPREGVFAVIAATSNGWDNYRHQADALAQYQLLRRNGVPDDHIILILQDDIAEHPENPFPGHVRNEKGGENLYSNVQIDYRLDTLSCEDFMDIIAGRMHTGLDPVLNSGERDNLYLFIVGHGGAPGVGWSGKTADVDESFCILEPERLNEELSLRKAAKGFRQALVVIESCHGGVMGLALDAPRTVMMTGANPYENSLAANYDLQVHAWVADDFAFRYWAEVSTKSRVTVGELYQSLYFQVQGSHVSIYNSASVGNPSALEVSEFLQY